LALSHIKLIGDPVENFYQLGLKDRENFLPLFEHIKKLASPKVPVLPEVLAELAKKFVSTTFYKSHEENELIKAYAEGLNLPFSDVALCTLLPEFLSSMGKWIPNLPDQLLGCSSFFYWDEERNCPGHTRVLDFPLIETFDGNERLLSYNFQNESQILSFSTSGFPFPSITCMNEFGVSFALHQKFTDAFDNNGTPIFQLVYELLKKTDTIESAIEFLENSTSVTTWCLLLGFPNGDVLAADISGSKLTLKKHKIKKGDIVYYNNNTFDESWSQTQQLPTGIKLYNDMRTRSAKKKIKKLQKEKITATKVHKLVCTPMLSKDNKNWDLDVVTPSSLCIVTMVPNEQEAFYATGPAPKYFNGELLHIENAFTKLKQSVVKLRNKKSIEKYTQGMRSLMLAQKGFDLHKFEEVYHYLQMAIDSLKQSPEVHIATFYFLALQFCEEDHQMIQSQILQSFIELTPNLPPHLQDHSLLFISRLERCLTGDTQVCEKDIKDNYLKSILKIELKIPAKILYRSLKPLINLRIDLLDVIYAHGSRQYTEA